MPTKNMQKMLPPNPFTIKAPQKQCSSYNWQKTPYRYPWKWGFPRWGFTSIYRLL